MRLNEAWHSRLPLTVKTNLDSKPHSIFFGAEYDGVYYAVAMWTDPIARKLNGRNWLELRRLAIAPDAPRNTASRMLRVMALLIRRRWPHIVRFISYQDTEVHTGGIYKAAGWTIGSTHKVSTGWATRPRAAMQSVAPKVRWELNLNPPHRQGPI